MTRLPLGQLGVADSLGAFGDEEPGRSRSVGQRRPRRPSAPRRASPSARRASDSPSGISGISAGGAVTGGPPGDRPNRALAAFIAFPAIVVPGVFADGLPVGIEILGRAYGEGDLLKLAYSYEQATLHRRPPWTAPPLPGEP